MRVLTVHLGKGGVGKSSTSYCLAGALVDAGKRVLLVDLDSNASLTLAYGGQLCQPQESIGMALAMPSAGLPRPLPHEHVDGLWLWGGTTQETGAAEALLSQRNHVSALAELLDQVSSDYDWCVIDTPPATATSTLVANAFHVADELLMPATPEWGVLPQIGLTYEAYRRRLEVGEASGQLRGLLWNAVPGQRSNERDDVMAEVAKRGIPTLDVFIPREVLVSESYAMGMPITWYARHLLEDKQIRKPSKAAAAFTHVAGHLLGLHNTVPVAG